MKSSYDRAFKLIFGILIWSAIGSLIVLFIYLNKMSITF